MNNGMNELVVLLSLAVGAVFGALAMSWSIAGKLWDEYTRGYWAGYAAGREKKDE